MLRVPDQIRRLRSSSNVDHDFTILWIPRRTLVADQILEEAGVMGDCTIHEYPLYFVPLADDLLSLELPDAFSDLYLVGYFAMMDMLTVHSTKTQSAYSRQQKR
jgi:vacuolar protein sorting-associated protein 33A